MSMVFCRGCANEIHETAPTCPRCGAPQIIPVAQIEKSTGTIKKPISTSWQKKFDLIEKAGGVKMTKIRDLNFGERMKVVFNIWPFLVGPFYYLIKGMWKKALVLSFICISIVVILEYVLEFFNIGTSLAGLVSSVIFATRANIDYYKKMVLGDNSWL